MSALGGSMLSAKELTVSSISQSVMALIQFGLVACLLNFISFYQGDEYLCPLCRLTICKSVLSTLGNIDKEQLFAEPVSELIAKNYYEIIKTPMDLKTMRGKAQK